MDQANVDSDFEEALKSNQKFFALFYASWCPFSRRFLPIYQRCTKGSPVPCIRIMIDDREDLCEKYDVNYYPTVLLFENGKVVKRLDAAPHEGLDEKQLKTLLGGS